MGQLDVRRNVDLLFGGIKALRGVPHSGELRFPLIRMRSSVYCGRGRGGTWRPAGHAAGRLQGHVADRPSGFGGAGIVCITHARGRNIPLGHS